MDPPRPAGGRSAEPLREAGTGAGPEAVADAGPSAAGGAGQGAAPEEGVHPPQPEATADEPCLLRSSPAGGEWLGVEHRRLERYPVQASRPIALRLLEEGRPQGPWLLADILDISRGGLCLMLSGALALPSRQRLQLDVRVHPDFGVQRLEGEVRWCHGSARFTTLGVAFLQSLPALPRLELERRSVRRDPNEEAWAAE